MPGTSTRRCFSGQMNCVQARSEKRNIACASSALKTCTHSIGHHPVSVVGPTEIFRVLWCPLEPMKNVPWSKRRGLFTFLLIQQRIFQVSGAVAIISGSAGSALRSGPRGGPRGCPDLRSLGQHSPRHVVPSLVVGGLIVCMCVSSYKLPSPVSSAPKLCLREETQGGRTSRKRV